MLTTTNLHPVFQQVFAAYAPPRRPDLTEREAELLDALRQLKSWCLHYAEPFASGTSLYPALQRDLSAASRAIESATGGNES